VNGWCWLVKRVLPSRTWLAARSGALEQIERSVHAAQSPRADLILHSQCNAIGRPEDLASSIRSLAQQVIE
jgi:hypothetical protein